MPAILRSDQVAAATSLLDSCPDPHSAMNNGAIRFKLKTRSSRPVDEIPVYGQFFSLRNGKKGRRY